MVPGYVTYNYLNVHGFTDFKDNLQYTGCHVSKENGLAVFVTSILHRLGLEK
jgi:hypothetical protein